MLGRPPGSISDAEPRRRTRAQWREYGVFFGFISPWIFGFFVVTMLPLLWGFYLSLTNFTGLSFERIKFVGAANYLRALNDPEAWRGLWHTAVITAVYVPVNLIGGFLLAVLLNQKIRGLRILRTLYYLPYVVPAVGMVVIWQTISRRYRWSWKTPPPSTAAGDCGYSSRSSCPFPNRRWPPPLSSVSNGSGATTSRPVCTCRARRYRLWWRSSAG